MYDTLINSELARQCTNVTGSVHLKSHPLHVGFILTTCNATGLVEPTCDSVMPRGLPFANRAMGGLYGTGGWLNRRRNPPCVSR